MSYDGFILANAEDEIIVHGADGAELDRVEYATPLWLVAPGISTVFDQSLGVDNSLFFGWCPSISTFGAGDAGTPGEENDPCGFVPD